jgi:hypothetical protein
MVYVFKQVNNYTLNSKKGKGIMAVKSLSISDELLEKITREAKQKNLSFSELVCQRISQSYVPVSSQKYDHGAEKILAKIDSLDTNFKQTVNALKKQNPQIDLENQLSDWLNILERRIKDKISVLGSNTKIHTTGVILLFISQITL